LRIKGIRLSIRGSIYINGTPTLPLRSSDLDFTEKSLCTGTLNFKGVVAMDNETRRNRAITALEAYSEEDDDLVSNIIDLLTDLLHLCKRQEIDFQACLLSAEINFESEK
jgi:hypothetical protein